MNRSSRITRTIGALVALATSTVACSGTPGAEPTAASTTVVPTTTPTTVPPGPVADQTPPLSTFGLAYQGNQLWVADFYRGQVLAVDPDSGAIVKRLDSGDGVSSEVNDIAVSPDGTIFWLGYNDGAVAVFSSNEYKTFARVAPGTYSLALSPDRTKLYAGGAVGRAAPLWTVDLTRRDNAKPSRNPATGEATSTTIRSFDVAPDGRIFAPRFGSAGASPGTEGALVQVDPDTAGTTDVINGLDGPIAVKLSEDGATAYVLSLPPAGKPTVSSFDMNTHRPLRPPVELRTALADNLAVAPDGRIFVSSYNDSLLNVVSPDGQVKTLHIGQPGPPS